MVARKTIVVAIVCAGSLCTPGTLPCSISCLSLAGQAKRQAGWPGRRVQSISARLRNEPADSPFSAEFRIREDQFGKIIKALSPPIPYKPGDGPPTGAELERGRVRIRYEDKSEDDIVYYAYGKNILIFSINEKLHRRGRPGNPNLRKEHSEIYGIDEEYIDESTAFSDLLKRSALSQQVIK